MPQLVRSVTLVLAAMSRSRTPQVAMHSSTRPWPVRKLRSATPPNCRSFPEIYC
jgi:hypothetical protein